MEVQVKPLSTGEYGRASSSATTPTATTTCSRCTGGNQARLALHLPLEQTAARAGVARTGARADSAYDTRRYYTLKVENDGPRIRAYIDGKLVLEADGRRDPARARRV